MKEFQGKPFYLTDEQVAWVEETLAGMSEDEKIGQLFCSIAYASDEEYLQKTLDVLKPAGIMLRPMDLDSTVAATEYLQSHSKIPLLMAANLEKGGSGAVIGATGYASPLEVAATGDSEMGRRMGEICGTEGAACGINWAFAPIIDIDYNFRNPITNTRTFGANPHIVEQMGVAYVKEVQKHGIAASIKHFPGDGCDERDQHLVTSINDLSCDEWDKTYGKIYSACIDAGAKTVMVGHIMQPAYERALDPDQKDEDMQPATLSPNLVKKLLRGKLGFKGLVVTDASTMAGMVINMPRRLAVPTSIAVGCDMFLFCRDMEEDHAYMKKGVQDGLITKERLDEAVSRVLALKASLGLPERQEQGILIPKVEEACRAINNKKHRQWARECAEKAITLVKEEPDVLPISPAKTKRVLFYPIESDQGFMYSVASGVCASFEQRLKEEGFKVTVYKPSPGTEGMMTSQAEVLDNYDLIIYLGNMATKSNQTVVRIEWAQPMGANVPIFMHDIPTIFISVENPYHLLDAPRIRTYINAYYSSQEVLDAVVNKLMGRTKFEGKSPVDAFCGKWDAKL